jgi:hypothetical protein
MDSLSSTSRGASLKESVTDRGVTQTKILGTVCPGFFYPFILIYTHKGAGLIDFFFILWANSLSACRIRASNIFTKGGKKSL